MISLANRIIKIANSLTLLRIIMTPFIMFFALQETLRGKILAFVLYLLAVLTDFCDGVLSRRFKQTSDFGSFMDPLADKFLVCTLLVSFVALKEIPAWMAVIILTREFAVTGLRTLGWRYGKDLVTSRLAKSKTILQMTAIGIILLNLLGRELINRSVWFVDWAGYWTMMAAVIVTFFSGIKYFFLNRRLLVAR